MQHEPSSSLKDIRVKGGRKRGKRQEWEEGEEEGKGTMREQEKRGSRSEVVRDPRSPPLESVGATLPRQRTSTDDDSQVDEDVEHLARQLVHPPLLRNP